MHGRAQRKLQSALSWTDELGNRTEGRETAWKARENSNPMDQHQGSLGRQQRPEPSLLIAATELEGPPFADRSRLARACHTTQS